MSKKIFVGAHDFVAEKLIVESFEGAFRIVVHSGTARIGEVGRSAIRIELTSHFKRAFSATAVVVGLAYGEICSLFQEKIESSRKNERLIEVVIDHLSSHQRALLYTWVYQEGKASGKRQLQKRIGQVLGYRE